jgi:hypothetical protein
MPANLTAQIPLSPAGFEPTLDNAIGASFRVSAGYDSNATWIGRNGGDQEYAVRPTFLFHEIRPQGGWNLQYSPGFDAYQHDVGRSRMAHSFNGTADYSPSDRLHFHVRQDYIRSTDPFDYLDNSAPPLGVLNTPNQSIASWDYTRLTSYAGIDYDLTAHDRMGVSATWMHYDRNGLSQQLLYNAPQLNQDLSGSLYFAHQSSERETEGLQLGVTDMSYAGSPQRVRAYSGYYSQTVTLGLHSSFMLYGGPELTQSHYTETVFFGLFTIPVSTSNWTPAGGLVYTWTGTRSSMHLELMRRVGEGSGLMQSVVMTAGTASLERQLSKNWRGHLNATGGDDIVLPSVYGRYRSLIGSAVLDRKLWGNLSSELSYDRIYQHSNTRYYNFGNHNRVQFALIYSLTKPVGY